MNSEELPEVRRTPQPDGSQGPNLQRPWAKWDVLSRGDIVAGLLTAVAIFFTAGSLFGGPPNAHAANPAGFVWVAPLVGAVFFIALLAMFAERERHGVGRVLLAAGSAALAVAGFVFMHQVTAARLVLFYWVPAILGICAALALVQAHKASRGVAVKVRHHRRRPK